MSYYEYGYPTPEENEPLLPFTAKTALTAVAFASSVLLIAYLVYLSH